YKRLLAFLKAMEFNTLIRRVAEFSGVDANQIDPDPKVGAGARLFDRPAAEPTEAPAKGNGKARAATSAAAAPVAPGLPLEGGGMKLKERPGGPAEEALSPQALAAARRDTAQNAKIDRSRYEVVRSPERLQEWVTRAIEQGVVAVDTQTSSIDPMQATLTGVSLALAPNEACYVPLGHRQGG